MSTLLLRRTTQLLQSHAHLSFRAISTLPNNSHIYVHPSSDRISSTNTLSLLPSSPPNPSLAIGTSSSVPPTPESLQENPNFLSILHSVLRDHATSDPLVQSQAQAYASTAGSSLGSGGVFFPQQQQRQPRRSKKLSGSGGPGYGGGGGAGGGGAGGASAQGGAGGGGVGGYIHVSDMRNPPDYGRIAWPEDIFGSLEVDGEGSFVDGNGRYQESGTYRICTREGILGLSPYLRERLVARLKELEKAT
ncbi:MAG: hypothetical protein Q9165_007464 [Trypethelium subeluteriae]